MKSFNLWLLQYILEAPLYYSSAARINIQKTSPPSVHKKESLCDSSKWEEFFMTHEFSILALIRAMAALNSSFNFNGPIKFSNHLTIIYGILT